MMKDLEVKGHANCFRFMGDVMISTCDKPELEVWRLSDFTKKKSISLPKDMKNSNGILIYHREETLYMIVTSWNVNTFAVYKIE